MRPDSHCEVDLHVLPSRFPFLGCSFDWPREGDGERGSARSSSLSFAMICESSGFGAQRALWQTEAKPRPGKHADGFTHALHVPREHKLESHCSSSLHAMPFGRCVAGRF